MAAGDREPAVPEAVDRDLSSLERRLGYSFGDRHLLETALTHRSAFHERELDVSYERLEFLGDAVLGLVTVE